MFSRFWDPYLRSISSCRGYDVAKQIRLEPWGTSPILIAITGWGQAEDKAMSREAGFDHHLVKPVDPDALLKFIQKRKAAHTESA